MQDYFTPSQILTKGESKMTGKRIQINLVVGSWALVLIALAAIMPSYVQAADVAYVATNPAPLSSHCSDTSAQETNRYRDYGTFTSYWNSCEKPIGASNLELTGPDRNYGTFAGVWTGYLDRVAAENSADVSFLAANPELMVAGRYAASNDTSVPARRIGYVQSGAAGSDDTSVPARRTGYVDRVAAEQSAVSLAANPELLVAGRYTAAPARATDASSSYLSANPELQVARRYTAAPTSVTEASLLATP
jgi:hypothetical protein